MYKYENKKLNISVKTNYNKRRKNKYISQEEPKINKNFNQKERRDNLYKNDLWGSMLSRTSKEGQNQLASNSKTYRNNFTINDYNNFGENKHFKKSNNYDYITTTQITTIPGGVKRNFYEIKDDYIFKKPYNYSRLFKSVYDYNSNINYEQHYDPIIQGYNINSFPTKQRYYGSYRRGVQDHDIFNNKYY